MTTATRHPRKSLLVPQVVERPGDLHPYRARMEPEAIKVRLCGQDRDAVLVLRCHALDVAAAAVWHAIDTAALATTYAGLPPWDNGADNVELIWVRWCPRDYDNPIEGGGDWERENRGTVGATPAVLLTPRGDR